MGVIRPSARVRLQLRVDEGVSDVEFFDGLKKKSLPDTAFAPQPIEASSNRTDQLEANAEKLRALGRSQDSMEPGDFEREKSSIESERSRLQSAQLNETVGSTPGAIGSGGPRQVDVIVGSITPISVSIQRNGFRTADTASVEIDYRNMPVDPRTVRSCLIEIDIGVVSEDDYAAGIRGDKRADGSLLSLVARSPDIETVAGGATRFIGIVDNWPVSFGAEGDVIMLECRDMTSLIIDVDLEVGDRIDTFRPLDEAIQEMLDSFTSTQGIRVVYKGKGNPPKMVNVRPRATKSRRGKVSKRRRAGTKMNLWDHISELCLAAGVVPVLRQFTLELLAPRTMFIGLEEPPLVLYGQNLEELRFNRKIQGMDVPIIEVRSYDPDIDRTRWARAPDARNGKRLSGVIGVTDPPLGHKANRVYPSGVSEERIMTFPVDDVTSEEGLLGIARVIYDEIGRQEITGHWATHDVTSIQRTGQRPPEPGDLLRLDAGDAIEVAVAAPSEELPAGTSLQELSSMSISRRRAFLKEAGHSDKTADTISRTQQTVVAQTTVFRIATLSIEWSIDSGLALAADFQNFIQIRNDILEDDTPGATIDAVTRGQTSDEANALRNAGSQSRNVARARKDGKATDDVTQSAASRARRDKELAGESFQPILPPEGGFLPPE